MITVDITSPGGAFTPAASGNTQELTTTFSITSGTNTLTCNGATPFVSGDTGKYILIHGPGSGGFDGTWLFTTMTFVSSSQVTLGTNATKTLTAASAYCAWGNDDGPAFRAFNTWAQAQSDSITLTLGTSKKFIFATGEAAPRGGSLSWGVTQTLTIQGTGSSSTKLIYCGVSGSFGFGATNYLKSGDGTWGGSSIFTARLNTVLAGSSQALCKTIADASLFTTNTWALLSSTDLMGTGQPPNPFLFEYVYMTNVNTGSGVITFQNSVSNAYLDTLPNFSAGTAGAQPDEGGPATLYVLDPGWNVDATFQGFTFINGFGQATTKARKLVFRDVTVPDTAGLIPTGSKAVEFYNCNLSSYQMEIDKITESVIFDATVTGQLLFQSSIDRVIIRNGSTISSLNGTPRFLEVYNSTVGNVGLGATSFGRTDSFITSGSTFNGTFTYSGATDSGDNTGVLQTDYTLSSSGVITMPRSGRPYAGLRWAVPGTRCYFTGRETTGSLRTVDWGPTFTVRSVTADATNIYVQTDWPYTSGFQSWMTRINVVPSQYLSFGSDTVSSTVEVQRLMAATAASRGIPGTYVTAALNGGNCGTDVGSSSIAVTPQTGGKLISLTVNVTTPYTGIAPTLNWGKATQFVLAAGGASFVTWNPRLDLKTAGTRVITPSGVTGTAGADANLSLPSADAWLSHWLSSMSTGSTDIRTEYAGNPSVGPVFTVEMILDQGFIPTAVAPLLLRLIAA